MCEKFPYPAVRIFGRVGIVLNPVTEERSAGFADIEIVVRQGR
jgi:hypothetical protein